MKETDPSMQQAIENFERFWKHGPLDGVRKQEGLPPVTQEQVNEGRNADIQRGIINRTLSR